MWVAVFVILANLSDEELTVPKATILGVAEEISESLVDKLQKRSSTEPYGKTKNEVLQSKLLKGKLDLDSRR
jgi:hypothetical protein